MWYPFPWTADDGWTSRKQKQQQSLVHGRVHRIGYWPSVFFRLPSNRKEHSWSWIFSSHSLGEYACTLFYATQLVYICEVESNVLATKLVRMTCRRHHCWISRQCKAPHAVEQYWQTQFITQYSTVQYSTFQYSTFQYSTVQYSTVQYSTVQYSTVQYSTVQYSTVQYSTVQYSTVQYSTVQYSTVQYSTVQYSTVQYSTVQYSTVQYSTVQYSTVQYSAMQCSAVQCSTVHTQTVLTNAPVWSQPMMIALVVVCACTTFQGLWWYQVSPSLNTVQAILFEYKYLFTGGPP